MSLVGADGHLIEPTILGGGEQGPMLKVVRGVRCRLIVEAEAEVLLGPPVTVHGLGRTTLSRVNFSTCPRSSGDRASVS